MVTKNLLGLQVFDSDRVPAGWTCAPLRERIELAYGRALSEERRRPGDTVVYGSNGPVGTHDEQWLTPPGIIVGRKGSVGAVCFADQPYWPIDTTYFVRPYVDGDSLRYIYHLLQYLPLRLLNAATGVPGLSRRDAYALLGAFPKPDEQLAIGELLDTVESVITAVKRAQAAAQRFKQTLASRLFSHGTKDEPTRETILGPLPASWQVVAVRDIAQFQYGLSVAMQQTGALPILRMGNIQRGEVHLTDLKYVTLPEPLSSRYLLRRGDVLFNRTNSQEHVGKVGIFRHDDACVFASYLIRLHVSASDVDSYYLGQVLGSYPTQCRIRRYATPGVQQVNINATNLGRVLIPLPTGPDHLDEQREIASMLERADEVSRAYTPMLISLGALQLSLRQSIFSGELRVPALNTGGSVD